MLTLGLVDSPLHCTRDCFEFMIGSEQFLCKQHGLNSKHVLEKEMTGKYVAIFGFSGKILKVAFIL